MVEPEIWDHYVDLGAEESWLGFPVVTGIMPPLRTGRQSFEGGTIYWKPERGPIAVRKAMDDYIFQDRALLKRLGFPVSEEQPMGVGGSDGIQFFQRGVVTRRDGKYEIWLNPEIKLSMDDTLEVALESNPALEPLMQELVETLQNYEKSD